MTKLRTGDHVRVQGRLGVDHHGIIDRRGRGGPRVLHASKDEGMVVASPLHEFSGGSPIELVRRARRGERLEIADRARERLGEGYSLFEANCEHLAYGASDDERSPQLRKMLGIALLAFVGWSALKN